MAKRVYFAFHYQDVIEFRANVVRKHKEFIGIENAGYYDHSIWEESKKQGDLALKRMINSELEYTSVTAVLIETHTWERRWVRYEIIKSIEKGNLLIGIHINGIAGSIAGKSAPPKALGPNPFNNLGLRISEDGTQASPYEWKDQKWQWYSDLEPFRVPQKPPDQRKKDLRLTTWYPIYDWVADSGPEHFCDWIL